MRKPLKITIEKPAGSTSTMEFEESWNRLKVDLDQIRKNYLHIKTKMMKNVHFYAVLKSDAYGHGIREVGQILADAGCQHFAVESPQEGISLRSAGIEGEILLMNPIPDYMAELSIRNDLSVSVIHESIIDPLQNAATALNKKCKVHLNINVGLNRLGIAPSKVIKVAKKIKNNPQLEFEAIFGQPREPQNAPEAFERLKSIYKKLKLQNLEPDDIHFANSVTLLSFPETRKCSARIGILLYGVLPPEIFDSIPDKFPLKPAMSLQTELVQIRTVPKGSKIGYRSKEVTKKETVLGIIPFGYNHGFDRKYKNEGYVLLRGKKIYFSGPISMNAATLDITGVKNPQVGENITILGKLGREEIKINDIAAKSGTISAELLMRFGKGVARIHEANQPIIPKPKAVLELESYKYNLMDISTVNDLPDYIKVYDIIDFIKKHSKPFSDSIESISSAVDYALSFNPRGNGFISLLISDKNIIGAAVCIQTDKISTIPENILVYLCVHEKFRNKGIGRKLITNITRYNKGNFKIHIQKNNPSITFLNKFGFTSDILELRLYNENND